MAAPTWLSYKSSAALTKKNSEEQARAAAAKWQPLKYIVSIGDTS
jgi:hypothetical protein